MENHPHRHPVGVCRPLVVRPFEVVRPFVVEVDVFNLYDCKKENKYVQNQRDKILYAYARTFEGMTRTQTSPSSANVITSGLPNQPSDILRLS